jgi:hypothetical protein
MSDDNVLHGAMHALAEQSRERCAHARAGGLNHADLDESGNPTGGLLLCLDDGVLHDLSRFGALPTLSSFCRSGESD